MATVSKTKDCGSGGGGSGGWRGGEGGITSAFCISCFLLGGPACQKEGRDGGKEGRREKHLTPHIEKERALNAIKARGEISH